MNRNKNDKIGLNPVRKINNNNNNENQSKPKKENLESTIASIPENITDLSFNNHKEE